jgi:hypothetical protein
MPAPIAAAIHNEQVKLVANLLNTLAAAFVVTGVIVPLIAHVYGTSVPTGRLWMAYGPIWVAVAFGFHQAARLALKGMRS